MARGYISLQYFRVLSTYMLLDIICIPDTNPTKGDVALVKASNGTVLRKVADDPEWQKIREEGDRRREEAAAMRPKKQGPSRKRPRTKMTSSHNNQDGSNEPPLPDSLLRDEPLPLPERHAPNSEEDVPHEEPHRLLGPSMPTVGLPSQQHEVSRIHSFVLPI